MSDENPQERRGRKEIIFAQLQLDEFLETMRDGYNRTMACDMHQITYRIFLRHLREDKAFAESVRLIEGSRVGLCEYKLLHILQTSFEPSIQIRAAIAYLGRRDKLDEARRVRREKAKRAAEASGVHGSN